MRQLFFRTLKGKDTAKAHDFALLQHAKKRYLYVVLRSARPTGQEAYVGNTLIGVLEKIASLLRPKAKGLSSFFFFSCIRSMQKCHNVRQFIPSTGQSVHAFNTVLRVYGKFLHFMVLPMYGCASDSSAHAGILAKRGNRSPLENKS